MIKKTYSKTGGSCRVTFRLPGEDLGGESVSVLGDFNGWRAEAHPLELRKNGSFSTTIQMTQDGWGTLEIIAVDAWNNQSIQRTRVFIDSV